MEQVRKRLAENREHLKKYYGTADHLQRLSADHLKVVAIALSRGMSKHQEDLKQAAEAKNLATQVAEQMRDLYASSVEQIFIKNGMDAQVKAGGKGKERLTITYALMSQPLVYKFQNEMDVPTQAKKMGFKKVLYTNGFESSLGNTWTVDL